MKKNIKYPLVKDVKLNNKSRKGTYVYVKVRKGERGSYYKKKKGLTKRDYLYAREQGIVRKKKGVTKARTSDRLLRKIKTRKKIEDILEKGLVHYNINNIQRLNTGYAVRSAYMSLLTNKEGKYKNAIVRDKELADILARPENVEKWKHRIEYIINVKSQDGKDLIVVRSAHQGKTIPVIVREVTDVFKIGNMIQEEGKTSPDVGSELKGYSLSRKGTGKIGSISMRIVFRKGK